MDRILVPPDPASVRYAFESWLVARAPYLDVARYPADPGRAYPGQYRDLQTQAAWEIWQAAVGWCAFVVDTRSRPIPPDPGAVPVNSLTPPSIP